MLKMCELNPMRSVLIPVGQRVRTAYMIVHFVLHNSPNTTTILLISAPLTTDEHVDKMWQRGEEGI